MAITNLIVGLLDRRYRVERPWGETPPGINIDVVSQVAVDSDDNVYVAQRIDPPIVVFDSKGNYLRSWGTGVIADAHGIFITPDDFVLVVDRDAHQVLGFSPEGDLQMEISERHNPGFQQPFNHPCDVAVASDGEIYVCDGYANSVVHRFAADGSWIATWGEPGSGPGQFTTPHAIWVTTDGRVLVADRENNRIQVFDRDGGYLTESGDHYHPMDIYADAEGLIYVTDQVPRLSQLDSDGILIGRCRPVLNGAHGVWGDSRGNLYLAESAPQNRITKLNLIDS
ncbi:MAG: peptidyl-alpha-hydroxyglycine alpha-amidating lyase family protein [Thermomicrobiales bacterium]